MHIHIHMRHAHQNTQGKYHTLTHASGSRSKLYNLLWLIFTVYINIWPLPCPQEPKYTHNHTQADKHTSSSTLHCHDVDLRGGGSRLDTQYIHVFIHIHRGKHVHKLANVSLNVTITVRIIVTESSYKTHASCNMFCDLITFLSICSSTMDVCRHEAKYKSIQNKNKKCVHCMFIKSI